MKTNSKIITILIFALICTVALFPQDSKPGSAAWKKDLLDQRAAKNRSFKESPTSPMAGVARLALTFGKEGYLYRDRNGIALMSEKPPLPLALLKNENSTWQLKDCSPSLSLEGKPLPASFPVKSRAVLQLDQWSLTLTPTADQIVITVFDPQRLELKNFKELLYFEPNAAFAVKAQIAKFSEVKTIKMLTNRNLEKVFYRYALARFTIQGQACALTLYKGSLKGPESNSFFIPFRDASNGKETYLSGRFMDVPEPTGSELILDFNGAYNPLCNYSPAYNCPLPPVENRLAVSILAGEKTYPYH